MICSCDKPPITGTKQNINDTKAVTDNLTSRQPTPTDIDYSLEHYNLIRRSYWVNGQLTEGGGVVGRFIVDGKVSSLNSFLSPDYIEEVYSAGATKNTELADVDGSYGENDSGIFFFTPDGKYVEWTGIYLYSDIPFEVESPVIKVGE